MPGPKREINIFLHNISALLSVIQQRGGKEAKAAIKRIHQRVPAVTQHLWDKRDRLELWNPAYVRLQEEPTCLLLMVYHALAENTSCVFYELIEISVDLLIKPPVTSYRNSCCIYGFTLRFPEKKLAQ